MTIKQYINELSPQLQKEYRKLIKKEARLEEKERRNGRVYLHQDFDEVLKFYPDITTLPEHETDKEIIQQQLREKEKALEILRVALIKLKTDEPVNYGLICDYYLKGKTTLKSLTLKYSLTENQVRYRLKLGKVFLRKFILKVL